MLSAQLANLPPATMSLSDGIGASSHASNDLNSDSNIISRSLHDHSARMNASNNLHGMPSGREPQPEQPDVKDEDDDMVPSPLPCPAPLFPNPLMHPLASTSRGTTAEPRPSTKAAVGVHTRKFPPSSLPTGAADVTLACQALPLGGPRAQGPAGCLPQHKLGQDASLAAPRTIDFMGGYPQQGSRPDPPPREALGLAERALLHRLPLPVVAA